jgi:hypothetical protein
MTTTLTSFGANASVTDIVATLKRDGGVIIRSLAPEQLMDGVYAQIEANVVAADFESNSELWPKGNKTIGALAAASPLFADRLLAHPKVLDVADAMLLPFVPMGPSARSAAKTLSKSGFSSVAQNDRGSTQVIYKAAESGQGPNCNHYTIGASVMLELCGPRGKNQILHRENAIYQPFVEGLPNMPEFIMSAMWAGTDFTRENGATRLVPGSHHWPEERVAQEHEITEAVMPKGSVVLWLSRSLHGASTSTRAESRVGFFLSYIVDWVRQEENQYIAVSPEAAQQLSLPARQLLGFRSSPHLGWVKGRDAEDLLTQGVSGNI